MLLRVLAIWLLASIAIAGGWALFTLAAAKRGNRWARGPAPALDEPPTLFLDAVRTIDLDHDGIDTSKG